MSTRKRGKPVARRSGTAGKRPSTAAIRSPRSAWAVVRDSRQSTRTRVAALAGLAQLIFDNDTIMKEALAILRDQDAPIALRLALFQTVHAASFSARKFAARRPAYLAAFRSLATDADPELRQRALGVLAREHDSYAQQRLMDGLKDSSKALVPLEKALQLLSYDIHSDAYPVAREIVRKPPSSIAKREALRLLAADAKSVPLFERILRDKSEETQIRQLAASALHALAPRKLQARARAIVLDRSDDDALKATCLTALTHFGEGEAIASDTALRKHVAGLRQKPGSAELKRSAARFRSKYGR
jgi:hypothetical protein